ncbi:MAG: copper transporter [Nocardioidaceae bacterium]
MGDAAMISFRYHVVSLLAVLFALAAGVALGAGVLDDTGNDQRAATRAPATDSGTTEGEGTGLDTALLQSLAPGLIANRLSGRAVTVVVLPDAASTAEKEWSSAVESAGGRVSGVVEVDGDLVDPAKKQLVDALGGQLENGAKSVTLPSGASTYDRIGALLGYAISTKKPGGDAPNAQAKSILAGLSTAGLASSDGDLTRRGGLVLIVGGEPSGNTATDQGTSSIVASIAAGIDTQSSGVVVVGPESAAGPGGILTGVRSDQAVGKAVSTVDSAEGAGGSVVVVGALVEQAGGGSGQYGVGDGATAVLPGSQGGGE